MVRWRAFFTSIQVLVVLAVAWGVLAIPDAAMAKKPPEPPPEPPECDDLGCIEFDCNREENPTFGHMIQGDGVEPYCHDTITGPTSGTIYAYLNPEFFRFREFAKKSPRRVWLDFTGFESLDGTWPSDLFPEKEGTFYEMINLMAFRDAAGADYPWQAAWRSLPVGGYLCICGSLKFGNKDNFVDGTLRFGCQGANPLESDPLLVTRTAAIDEGDQWDAWTIEPGGKVAPQAGWFGETVATGYPSFRMTFVANINHCEDPAVWQDPGSDIDCPETGTTGSGTAGTLTDTPFLRGDSNGDGAVNLNDAVHTLSYLFLGGPGPGCPDAADSDDNGRLEITDPVLTLGWLFAGRGEIPEPGPAICGPDTTDDALPDCEYDPVNC